MAAEPSVKLLARLIQPCLEPFSTQGLGARNDVWKAFVSDWGEDQEDNLENAE